MEWLPLLARLGATLAVGLFCGALFKKFRVPGGLMIGAFAGVAVLNATSGFTWLPSESRIAVQIVAGAFVGCLFERSDLARMRRFLRPIAVMLLTFLALTLIVGFILWTVTPLDLVTSLMSAVPGGINDVPIIAADMGADAPVVTLLQLMRVVLGVGIFPLIIEGFDRLQTRRGYPSGTAQSSGDAQNTGEARAVRGLHLQDVQGAHAAPAVAAPAAAAATVAAPTTPAAPAAPAAAPTAPAAVKTRGAGAGLAQNIWLKLLVTLAVAGVAGVLGKLSGVPGLTFTASLAAVLVLKLGFNFAFLPTKLKRLCQLLAGSYLGTLFTQEGLLGALELGIPVLILVAGYTINVFASGWLESRLFGYSRKEGMLIVFPAGGSELVFIMEDLGVKNPDIIVMQITKVVVVIAVFPQIINLICHLIEG